MKIPKKIKGFGIVYPIIQKNKIGKNGYWGRIDHDKCTIEIKKDLHKDRKAETLLHELIHMVGAENRIKLKEKQVDALSRGLYYVLKDNNLIK